MTAIVLGAGNPLRRDDGAGPVVVERLAGRLPSHVAVAAVSGGAVEILSALQGAGRAVLVDATSSGAPTGTVHRFDAAEGPLPASFTTGSSHGLGVAEAVELARALGQLPPHLVIYGIEGEDFGMGEGLTPAVAAAVERVAETVMQELEHPLRARAHAARAARAGRVSRAACERRSRSRRARLAE